MDLKELESGVDPNIHWYYQSKMIPLEKYVRKVFSETGTPLTLVDVGSGSGFFMHELLKKIPGMIKKIYLVDIGYTADEIQATQYQLIEKTTTIPDQIDQAVVVMMDVLEHLERDNDMLLKIREHAAGGSNRFFITVPAFMDLWSDHDVYLGHYRRYTLSSLRQLLSSASYNLESGYYIYSLIFPLVWLARKFRKHSDKPESDMKPAGAVVNSILKLVCKMEMPFRRWNRLAGVTVVAEGKI